MPPERIADPREDAPLGDDRDDPHRRAARAALTARGQQIAPSRCSTTSKIGAVPAEGRHFVML
jgi:hypothetical protein